ncbi:3-deoxy-manno-octulosonate cytidylyltransferase [Halobaculum magnesiiphilum]|uniref:N-acylneuraminate cytidylyltransferase n=1 Tax=Halobaculum magnesiiphilum TaxID=1017351 RepID=A0A8T8WEM7_9EURY|nr:3-deoxy-manno-octulosonate cytidylyltransferase [Halobaculum magnesiiphilum]QZP38236.1 3-deoxy-manno-octulosonate cytidylyltransferase [Halobaculum magnesiiphilum]
MGRLVFSDVDGVLTDSKINIGQDGEIFKSFNVKDGYGIVQWRKQDGNDFVFITSRESQAVVNRALELGVEEVHQGVKNKQRKVKEIASRLGFDLTDTVYIGDDLTDLQSLKTVGTACSPKDAAPEIKNECSYVSQYNGGDGAVRDILNYLESVSQTTLGVIPARYGSTRLPGKPLIKLAGKPMIQHVYERARDATLLDDLIVATDDERIAEAVEAVGGTAVMTDPDHPTGTDRVAEVAANVEADFTINIQGDEPLIDPDVIDAIVLALRESSPKVATPISTIEDNSLLDDENTVKVVTDTNGRALYFSRAKIPSGGEVGNTYKHIGLYGFKTELLLDYVNMESKLESAEDLEQLRLLENGYEIQTVETDYDPKEVNVKRDIQVVEEEMQRERTNETH